MNTRKLKHKARVESINILQLSKIAAAVVEAAPRDLTIASHVAQLQCGRRMMGYIA